MNRILRIFMITALGCVPLWAAGVDLKQIYSPNIVGDTLIIQGRIDSHIYEFLSREEKRLQAVKTVELDSFGGNFEWALAIAERMQKLNVTTYLPAGHVCASSCVLLFAAGVERRAATGTWFGIHGTRLNAGKTLALETACANGPTSKRCVQFVEKWRPFVEATTARQFDFYEAAGVSADLRRLYMSLQDDTDWLSEANILKKPDFVLSAEEAYHFYLVTKLENSIVTAGFH